ncbi:PREDICTED: zinc finger with UFM1-specific peptidase domain protein-like [Fragaria vesca subsp. vesca]|uniref:zinc finger with UFM1-specific peptidase domain protein-like n=1 Tax=Fragaria vesca subsp. vesca TaxID=101020 RepID=UPI0002C3031D|nr:PREDICTED: zinc finger with UFM1-specific peptidase domain protein-like [Fragaria vesca subsp. vesca]
MDDYSSCCPFCSLTIPSSQLERHANSHFEAEDEQLAMDLEFAHQLALAPSSPPSMLLNNQTIRDLPFVRSDGQCGMEEGISSLVALQTRTTFYEIEGGVTALLRGCLELEPRNTTTILCGYTDHIQSIRSEDSGWGCGWRNIQMLSSHLLMQRQETRDVLFGGAGFVPDIPSLQRWLEIAWGKGFDVAGSDHFNNKIYGLRRWIGTTECAALFRSFGLRARIVDFGPKELEPYYLSLPGSSLGDEVKRIHNGGKRKAIQVRGPMDRYLPGRSHDINQASSSCCEKSSCSTSQKGGDSWGRKCDYNSENKFSRKSKGHQVLMDWIWNYFNDGNVSRNGNHRVIISNKTPLYFQHDGHSRTIVGIQVKNQHNGMQQHTLLILDPGHRTAELERSLREKRGWQKFIKRGVHTLRKPQYQLCYIDSGIASGDELELLKTVDSVFLEL